MKKPNLLASALLFSFILFGAAACGSASPSEASGRGGQAETADAITACDVDDDCVAVSKGGCCPNGWLTAVNALEVDAYAAAHVCEAQTICPLYVVKDARHASCNQDTKQCEMITVDDDATSN